MVTTIRVLFDGEVLRPDRPVDLHPNTTYLVTIEGLASDERNADEATHPLSAIRRLATDMGVPDLSVYHDRYAHGPGVDSDRGS